MRPMETAPPPETPDDEWEAFAAEAITEGRVRPKLRLDALAWVAIAMAVLTVAGLVMLRPTGQTRQRELSTLGLPSALHAAEIVSAEEGLCPDSESVTCTTVRFELIEGPDIGFVYEQVFPESAINPAFDVGAVAILSRRAPNGRVTAIETIECPFDPTASCRLLTVELTSEADVELTYVATAAEPAALLAVGDVAMVELYPDDDFTEALGVSPPDAETAYQFSGDFQRRPLLLWATIIFAAVVIAVGRLRGVLALTGLGASIAVLMLFVLPAILDGRSPVLVAVVGASAIAFVTLYLAHGFTRMTTVALVGMISALVLTAVLSAIAVSLARFSGFANEETTLLTFFDGIDVRGLLLAGIVLGTAGALDDVTVTQASAVWQLKAADPGQDRRTLFGRAIEIGRDHIASTVNTLLLAYAGAALPLLILFVVASQSLGAIANSEVVAVEIIRTVVGSIGLVAAVPITTWLAVRSADGSAPPHSH